MTTAVLLVLSPSFRAYCVAVHGPLPAAGALPALELQVMHPAEH